MYLFSILCDINLFIHTIKVTIMNRLVLFFFSFWSVSYLSLAMTMTIMEMFTLKISFRLKKAIHALPQQ